MNAAPEGPGEDRLEGQPNHKQQTADEMADLAHTRAVSARIGSRSRLQLFVFTSIFTRSRVQTRTGSALAQQYEVHPNQITAWKGHLVDAAAGLFGSGSAAGDAAPVVDVKTLHAKIGELILENDFLAGALSKAGLLSAKR